MALQKEHVVVQPESDLQLKQNERLQEHLQTLRDEFARRINQLEHALAGVEHQRAEAEQAMLAQEAAEARTCCVCYEVCESYRHMFDMLGGGGGLGGGGVSARTKGGAPRPV